MKPAMKTALLISLLTLTAASVNVSAAGKQIEINSENFPDEVFREYVSDNFDKNNDGKLSKKELAPDSDGRLAIKVGMITSDLTGIEFFEELTHLSCDQTKITKLDVSKNTKLKVLNCSESSLMFLDLSNNKALEYLNCEDNKIMKLDLSGHDKLEVINCRNNKLRYLDISGCEALEELICDKNLLESLDTSECPKLTKIYADDNRFKQVKLFHPDPNSNVKYKLSFRGNYLTSIDLSGYNGYDVALYTQSTHIKVKNGKYDLSELEKYGFDPKRIKYIQGAEYDPDANAFVNFSSNEIYYGYDCGNGRIEGFYMYAEFFSDDINAKPFLYDDKLCENCVISWDKRSGIDKYVVERFDEKSGRWEVIAETTDNYYPDYSVEYGVYYKYRICAYVNGKKGKYSNVVKAMEYFNFE